MSIKEPTLEDVIEYFHITALQERSYSSVYVNKLKGLIDDLSTPQYDLIHYYDFQEKLYDYNIKIMCDVL